MKPFDVCEAIPRKLRNGYESVPLIYTENYPLAIHRDTLGVDFRTVLSHFHKEVEILHIVEGEAVVGFNQKEYTVHAGEAVLVGPYSFHSIRLLSSKPCVYDTLVFNLDMLPDLFDRLYYPFHLITDDPAILQAIATVIEEHNSKAAHYQAVVRSYLSLVLVAFLRTNDPADTTAASAAKSFSKIRPIIDHIHEHFREKISLEDLCERFHISTSSLCAAFVKTTGKSVTQYVNFIRCQHARNLILSGKYSVSEAAYRSGFQSLSYFSKKYRECYGYLPSECKPDT